MIRLVTRYGDRQQIIESHEDIVKQTFGRQFASYRVIETSNETKIELRVQYDAAKEHKSLSNPKFPRQGSVSIELNTILDICLEVLEEGQSKLNVKQYKKFLNILEHQIDNLKMNNEV